MTSVGRRHMILTPSNVPPFLHWLSALDLDLFPFPLMWNPSNSHTQASHIPVLFVES